MVDCIDNIIQKKKKGEKITMLTAYDYPTAKLVDQAGVDMVLVGDSLAQVVLGLESTREVTMDMMLHHARAVRRGIRQAVLVGDLPYEAYQERPRKAFEQAKRFIDDAGCNAVKLEWFDKCLDVVEQFYRKGIPVMGHVGLTPQTADRLGGFKVQGRDASGARKILENALALEAAGCFSVVLECVPAELARLITEHLSIPTIGIGAGPGCDGQVLVFHDAVGLFDRFHPKFVKTFVAIDRPLVRGLQSYVRQVKSGKFPAREHIYTMRPEQWQMFLEEMAEHGGFQGKV